MELDRLAMLSDFVFEIVAPLATRLYGIFVVW